MVIGIDAAAWQNLIAKINILIKNYNSQFVLDKTQKS